MTPSQIHGFFSQIQPFQSLPEAVLNQLALLARVNTFEKGETIYAEGDPAEHVWVLREGRLQIFKYTSNGRPIAIESIAPNELFGTLCRIGGAAKIYTCTAVAATPCVTIRLSDRIFWEAYSKHPPMALGVCSLCSQRLKAQKGMSCQAQEPVEKRIATILLNLQKSHGNQIPFTKRELAELAGTTVETAIRTISDFTRKGWTISGRGLVTLKQPAAIQKFLNTLC